MSFSFDSLALRRKRTATERAENNGDPLVAKKKAHEAAKSKLSNPAQPVPTFTPSTVMVNMGPIAKTSSNVSL